ncbi:RNA polymerase sigma-70 factor [Paenibacillus sp. HWE-109]|uniref:RNA polymerase sigma-70 factor n=1 Tax=Paenibacillus sp. HWE-109 TaxID=1306526 RepID=UPI001EDFEA33|nr:RNA polymerase sigma-70 factor [Paenibacillus sp. HWE-109]UKS30857.1 RNA polymerase sigma-70 factor [Paenibacillus sp. HWE-109]
MDFETIYRTYKQLLFSVAYRMLGSVSDAEDMMQDLFASLPSVEMESVNNPKAYLVKMMTNRCLNYLKSARKQREVYVGEWLPEPWIQNETEDPIGQVVQDETVSYAFLVLLQTLSPMERAVFVLREVLGYEYGELAEMLGKSEPNCRKIYSRAKDKINKDQSQNIEIGHTEPLVQKFLRAVHTGNFQDFVAMLTEDAVLISDGGGKKRAAINPILGKLRIKSFFEGIAAKGSIAGEWQPVRMNGQMGLVLIQHEAIELVICFDVNEQLQMANHVYFIKNPDKLQHLSVQDCHKTPISFVL